MHRELEDKIAIVTGAGSGQGMAVANAFAESGATVVGVDIRFPTSNDNKIVKYTLDVANRHDVSTFVDWMIEKFERCDVLYNNAGICLSGRGDGPVEELSDDAWKRTIDINAKGSFYMAGYIVPWMLKQRSGVIINVASTRAVVGGPGLHAYAASKGAVLALSRSIALSYGSEGVRSVCLSPGVISTPMTEWIMSQEEVNSRYERQIPMGRFGRDTEIAELATFLASNRASYVNGANIVVDGGLTIW